MNIKQKNNVTQSQPLNTGMHRILFFVILVGVINLNAQAADNQCMPIGGATIGEAIDETHLVATLSGSLAAANARITNQKKTDTGLILDMEHDFISDKGGLLKTKDQAILTTVSGKDQTYMAEITYNVIDSKGAFAGYKGKFVSFGLIKLGEGKVIVRYSGELCK
jgi:predicted thioesterase